MIKNSTRRRAVVGLSPARSKILKKRLRELDSQISLLDKDILPLRYAGKDCWQKQLREKRAKLDQKRKETRNELKYGAKLSKNEKSAAESGL